MLSAHQAVLSVGADTHLLSLREQVLREAGFDVITSDNERQAISLMREGICGTLVICHTLQVDARQRLVENYRRFCPRSRIIGVSSVPFSLSTADTSAWERCVRLAYRI